MSKQKQAIIITAYKDIHQLEKLIDVFDDRFNIYVHFDRKAGGFDERLIERKNVKKISREYSIGWGSLYHVFAIIDLMKAAVKDSSQYIHIISGQDYISKNINDLYDFFRGNKKIYMTVMGEEEMPKKIIARYKKGSWNSFLDQRKYSTRFLNLCYGLFRRKGNIGPFTKIYKGLVWSSMPLSAAKYVLDFVDKDESFLNDLKHCQIPEEFFFQTIIMNSRYKRDVVFDDLRYNDWECRYNSVPAYLDESDYKRIIKTNDFFCRKIDSTISEKLLFRLDLNIKQRKKG